MDEEKKADVLTHDTEVVNQASALWARPKSEITDEQYVEFYKHVAHDFEPPLAHVHARVEGKQEYTQLLYLPAHAPFDLWDREHRHGIASTCAASSSWTTRSSSCRCTCASCAASSTRTTCRSTSRARSCSIRATSRQFAPAR
ncbi:MAG: hypothetical protein U1E63_14985 [Burkholderiales bacterium]